MDKDCYVPDCAAHKEHNLTVTLIGGSFHRQKINLNYPSNTIKMPLPFNLAIPYDPKVNFHTEEIKTETYRRVGYVYELPGIFPDNIFLYEKLDPIQFLKNIILDYLR